MADSSVRGDMAGLTTHVEVGAMFHEDHFRKEIDGIFGRSWLPVCHTFDLPNPGDFRVRDLPGLGVSLLITRARDGAIRAFHNICRHRGNKLACQAAGHAPVFVCSYHGWAYNLDGSLRAITDRESFPPIDKEALALKPVHVDERHTFVFVNLSETPEPLEDWLEALGPRDVYDGFFERFAPMEMTTTEVAANWNLGIDAFSENYHTMFVHKNTLTDYQGGEKNPNRHVPITELMRRHARVSIPANTAHRQMPTESLVYGHTAPAMPSFEHDSTGLPPGVNFGELDDWAFDVVKLYPNCIVLTGRNWFIETYFWPISKDRSVAEWALHLLPAKTWGERVAQEFPHLVNREVACEDLSMMEVQHAALAGGAVTDFWLSFQEIMLAHHYRTSRRMLEQAEAA